MDEKKRFLDQAYGVGSPAETRELYRQWAKTYDDEVRANGYVSPARVAAAMAEEVADKGAPLLDLGCGTGLSGEAFAEAGFSVIDGTDFSAEMLEVARAKGIYRKLVKGDLAQPIPARPGDYGNIAAVGVFSPGHAPADMIDGVFALLPEGGCFGFTLNDHALDEKVYEERVRALCEGGAAEIAFSRYGPHLTRRAIQAKVLVLRKT